MKSTVASVRLPVAPDERRVPARGGLGPDPRPQLGARADAELAVHAGEVGLHGLGAHVRHARDLAVREPLRRELRHAKLRRGELLRGTAQADPLQLGARSFLPGRRPELREQLERATEGVRCRATLPGPPVEPAADEVRQGEVERQARRSLEIELVEGLECPTDVPLRREHERPGTRQRCSDPQAGEDSAALLEPLELLARPLRLVERDERLDMERLAAVREHLALTGRLLTLPHARQRPVDGSVVARRVLDERERREHQPFPPDTARRSCLLDQRHECLPGSLDPTAARVDDGPHAERHGPGSRLLDSRDHRARLLDEPLGLVPAPRAELGERDVGLPLGPPVFLAVHAVPLVLDRMTGPRPVEVVDASGSR